MQDHLFLSRNYHMLRDQIIPFKEAVKDQSIKDLLMLQSEPSPSPSYQLLVYPPGRQFIKITGLT